MPSKENNDSMFKPKTPHFFKIVLEDTIRDKKLGIPRKFVKKYGNGLSDSVLLMVPSGDTWHVELTKSDGVVWLQNGWEEFVAFYSLKNGHFLVFKYEGNDKFIVLIFDMSASEIEYPCKSYIEDYQSGEQVCLKPVKEESKDDTCGEITHKTPPSKETRKRRSQPSCSKPRKKQQTNKKDNDIAMSRKSKEKSNSPCPLGNLNEVENSPGQVGQVDAEGSVQAFGCLRHLTATEKVHAIEIANAFKSNGNPVFMVVMRPSFVCNRYRMCIPLDFAKRFLTKHTGNLTLCNLAGKTWTAMYFRNSGNKILKAQLYGGWREFVEDNHLGVGDMCVFELIKHPEILMKVMVYSIVENASKSYGQPTHGSTTNRVKTRSLVSDTEPTCQQSPCPSSSRKFKVPTDAYIEILDDSPLNQKTKKKLKSPSTPTEKQRACMGASNFRTSNPSFSVVMHTEYVSSCTHLSVPYKFVKSYLDEEKDEAVLQVADGRTWIVKFAVKVVTAGQHKAEFSNWRTFAQDNNLNVKDVCVFELINRHENSFKVSIFSASPGANTSLLQKADDVKAIEADDDFGNCSTGNSSPAAKLATIGCQENEEEVNHTNDAIASQVASKGCLVPNIEADDDFGNCSAEHRSPAAELTTIGYQEDRGQVNPTDYAKASQVASEGSLVPKTEADGDFGNCSAGNSCPAAQLTATGYQENQEQINPTVDAGAIQVSSKDCLVPIIDATADIGNFYAGNSIPASQFTVIGYQETEEEVKPSISTWPKDPRAEHTKGKSHQSQASGTLKALQRACDFKSLNPFFIITMQPSYVCNEYRLAIPLHFSRKYLTNESGDVILFVPPNGKAWLTVYRREATESNPRAKLIDGWKPFVEDNNLEIGDVCVFEMSDLKRYELLLNVVIYKAEKR
ncbi:B3 domain-containing protein Os03g0619600-like [Hibiscus syriacus]|uniref:B3 domain-containing protein Os03g0619600-like n=1 Tax=Hibiscus syriacus TaxID=106335 RepID=UPI001920B34A|nr:B3 domain-containing protein Os03g0619600-like [Hibiscus syriacus]